MKTEKASLWTEALIALACLGMIAVNALAVLLPLGGVETGAVSDAYPNLFAPDGLTFSIWGVIYLLLAAHVFYRLGLFRGAEEPGPLLRRTGPLFAVSSLLNAAWIFAWHYGFIPLTMALMAALFVCLAALRAGIGTGPLTLRERLFVRLPFSVYFGWITVASIANAAVLLVRLGWDGFGLPQTFWTAVILAVGAGIGCLTVIRMRDAAYGLVFLWAYAGILRKHLPGGIFAGAYPAVVWTVSICLAALLFPVVWVLAEDFLRARRSGT